MVGVIYTFIPFVLKQFYISASTIGDQYKLRIIGELIVSFWYDEGVMVFIMGFLEVLEVVLSSMSMVYVSSYYFHYLLPICFDSRRMHII